MYPIIDLHNHPSLKPYNNFSYKNDIDIWKELEADHENYRKLKSAIRSVIFETARDSQANLNEWIKGDIQSCVVVLHPAERGWFAESKDQTAKIRKFLLSLALPKKHIPHLGAALTGFPIQKVQKIINRIKASKGVNYFDDETYLEYKFIKDHQNQVGEKGYSYKFVNDYNEYSNAKNKDKQLAMILSIEGGHALTDITKHHWFYTEYDKLSPEDQNEFKENTLRNVRRIKGDNTAQGEKFENVPFFVTFSHMYNNLLAGHAKSYGAGHNLKPGMDDLLDQSVAMNCGITEAGKAVLESLLSRDNGKRILIDVKHMSMMAREEYYTLVEESKSTDPIPIIASHAAVNGFESNDLTREDTYHLDKNSYLSRWSINLSNKDIQAIHQSDGIVGIVIHEGRTPGGRTKKLLKKLKKKNAQNEIRECYCQLILSNIFQIILAIGEKSAWDHIGIGSDYDGIMDPFNYYHDVSLFQGLVADIEKSLENPKPIIVYKNNVESIINPGEIQDLMFGQSPQEIVKKLASENVESFLSKYFTDQYLVQKPVVPQPPVV